MKRLVPLLMTIAALLLALLVMPVGVLAQDGHGDGDPPPAEDGAHGAEDAAQAARRGAAVYAEFCQACHGPQGEAIGTGPAFPAIAYDAETAPDVIANGQDTDPEDGVAMPGYGAILSDAQQADLLAYMQTWEAGDTPPLPEPNVTVPVGDVPDYSGDAGAGAVVYAKFCASCHGPDGEGRGGDAFPALAFDALSTRRITAEGAASDFMPAFSAESGGPLTEQQITDLETYFASWAVAPEADADTGDDGIAVMIVLAGVLAILLVGVVYMARPIAESDADDEDNAM